MANEQNLLRYGKDVPPLSREEAQKNGRKGGKASAESRRKSKQMKTVLEYLMEQEVAKKGGGKGTTLEAICTAMVKEAMAGSVKATEFIRNTLGQMPEETHVLKGAGLSIVVADEEHKEMLEDL